MIKEIVYEISTGILIAGIGIIIINTIEIIEKIKEKKKNEYN